MKSFYSILAALVVFSSAFASEKKKTTTIAKKSTSAKAITNTSSNAAASNENFIYAGPVEIQAISASKVAKTPIGNEYFDYLGKNLNEQSVQDMIVAIPGDYDVANTEGNLFYIWRSSGLVMKFDNKNKLQQIRFMNGKEFMGSYCNAFSKELPKKLNFNMKRSDIEGILGKPVEMSNPSGDERFFATYSIDYNDYAVVITYNTNSNQEMSAGIEDFLIMKTVHQPSSSNQNNQSVIADAVVKNNSTISIDAAQPVNFIGRPSSDPAVKKYIEQLGDDGQLIKYDESTQVINKNAGLVMNFDNQDKLASVMFTSSKNFLGQSFKQYQGNMPADLNFNLTREQVEKKLGIPAQTSNNDKDDFWAMYVLNSGTDAVYITYNTKSTDNTAATISDIRMEKLK